MRQNKNSKMLTLRIPHSLFTYLTEMAMLEETTLSNRIREILVKEALLHRVNTDAE
jgi:hypothetical protein